MIDKADSNRPERCSALIAHELSRLNIDIAALSEVRFADEGNLWEHGAGYTLYWSGKSSTERRLSGVGFMMKNSIATKLETLPRAHSDRIISMRLPLEKKQHLTIFSVYAPTLMAEPADKDSFYTDLRQHLNNTPVTDKILILGDFNARTRDLGERPGPPPLYHQTLHSLADFALGPADPVSACSAMSGHADNVVIHCPLNLRQRSQAERDTE
ncbi:craniofacial development protein 2 [Plakobranchus ocellatus]|uniref:Craniofacial development protein 2 n=1 Tax=Plakobranchus ocellatus TaxID=259542 RepID=A0AAV3ZIR5_9GAST|nr:craniofacial development protein 2 [Plakobranchus ocellatus]